MKLARCVTAVCAASLLGLSAASATTLTLDFDTAPGPDGVIGTADDQPMPSFGWIRDQYTPMGITFSQGTVMQSAFFDGNPSNHFISSTNPIGSFSIPVYGIRIESYAFWNATLSAYDADGNLLATDRFLNPGGIARTVLSLSTSSPIVGFSVLPDDPNQILNLDNMVLSTDVPATAVPEPTTAALMVAGLALLGLRRRRS